MNFHDVYKSILRDQLLRYYFHHEYMHVHVATVGSMDHKYQFTAIFYFFSSWSEHFCAITAIDLLEKVNLIPKRSSKVIVQQDSRVSNHSGQSFSLLFSDIEQQETNIEKLAYRFNQVPK